MIFAIFGLFSILLISSVFGSEFLENHTFQPPFQDVDSNGARIINENWRTAGTAVVNSNFIRLTPDRQSKKGAIWSRKAVGVPYFSSVLKFRISGQGKLFFGDGIGWWIVQQSYYNEGDLHGFQEKFVGIGIIFDTFKNTENLANHRDVTILVNDGSKTYEMMTADVQGCNTNVRFHAQRADFSVLDASRAKIIVDDNTLQVYVDARNTGEWAPCVNVSSLNLPAGWLSKSHLGITASTGQLADNHDVLYLKTFSDAKILDAKEEEESNKVNFSVDSKLSLQDQIKQVEQTINKLITAQETLDHHLEHQVASIMDHIKNLIGKIEKREDKSESRLENLEKLIKKEVEGSLEKRLTSLELQMKGSVEKKMTNIESALDRKMNNLESKASEIVQTSTASSWKLPFLILVVILTLVFIGLYLFYLKMKKMHIL